MTGREAEKAAREWAASRNQQRPPELQQWPWVLERWNGRIRDWEQINAIP